MKIQLAVRYSGCCPIDLGPWLSSRTQVLGAALGHDAQVFGPDLDVLRCLWHYRLVLHTSS